MRGLPGTQILGREMVEIAARRRTYVVRVCVALLMLGVYGIAEHLVGLSSNRVMIRNGLTTVVSSHSLVGHGHALVTSLIVLMSIAVSVMVPAMAALSVTTERERGTLVLLVLTPMSVISLVVQKYLSQLLAAAAICLLAVPLMAVGYTLGGMQALDLLTQIAFVAVVSCQVAAIGLAAGCLARSAASAIVLAYTGVLLLHLTSMCMRMTAIPWLLHCSPYLLFVHGQPLAERMLAPLGLALAMLAIARATLPWRLEATTASRLARAVKRMDAGLEAIDAKLFRLRPRREVDSAHPICWREVNRSFFCSGRFMVRVLLPALAAMVLIAMIGIDTRNRAGTLAVMLAFMLGALLLAIVGASIVNRERADQTLEVLLTTRLTARAIVLDKMRSLARLRWELVACMALTLGVIWWRSQDGSDAYSDWGMQRFHVPPMASAVEIALQLSIYSWIAVMIGLRFRPLSRAVMLSLAAILAMTWGEPVLQGLLQAGGMSYSAYSGDLLCMLVVVVSPLEVIADNVPRDLTMGGVDLMLGWLASVGIWAGLAMHCRRRAERWLSATIAAPS